MTLTETAGRTRLMWRGVEIESFARREDARTCAELLAANRAPAWLLSRYHRAYREAARRG